MSLFGGIYFYYKATRPVTPGGRYAMVILGLVMLGTQARVFFGPPPPGPHAAAITALSAYLVLAGVAFWLERKRV
jgi:hypothetical protein